MGGLDAGQTFTLIRVLETSVAVETKQSFEKKSGNLIDSE